MNELETAKLACMEAGKIAMKYFNTTSYQTKLKGPRNIVTQADIECEQRIRKIISREYSGHSFVGEEFGEDGDSKNVWIIDPIDGTTNFVHGFDNFSHSIAYANNGKVVCGAVYNPVQKKIFTAQIGEGSRLNGKKISVSKTFELENSLLIGGFPYDSYDLEEKTFASMRSLRGKCRDIRLLGSAALDLCYVAQGACDGFFEYKLNSWDIAAGLLIVREAGGQVTDINGVEAQINSTHIFASNGRIHGQVLKNLEKV